MPGAQGCQMTQSQANLINWPSVTLTQNLTQQLDAIIKETSNQIKTESTDSCASPETRPDSASGRW
jgi:hypothetical protein